MKAASFSYSAPESLEEVLEVLGQHEDDAKILAGGQSLVPVMAMRLSYFDQLVDLQRVADLVGVSRTNGTVRVAAMTTHATVGDDAVAKAVPLLAKAAPFIGHEAIRNRGTVGGAIAHADPAAEWPAVALALDAQMEITGPTGTRQVPATEFFGGFWTTAIEPVEVLTAVHFPVWQSGSGFAVTEAARRHGDFAMAGAVCGIAVDAGRVTRAALAFLGVDSTPVRASAAEAALLGTATADIDPGEIAAMAVEGLTPPDDLHASGAQRLRMCRALAERALIDAIGEVSSV